MLDLPKVLLVDLPLNGDERSSGFFSSSFLSSEREPKMLLRGRSFSSLGLSVIAIHPPAAHAPATHLTLETRKVTPQV
jgi:coproporphyrinogen III oxidase